MSKLLLTLFSFIFLTFNVPALLLGQDDSKQPLETTTGYISDFLLINIRDHIESPFSVVASVKSNEPVSILDEQGRYLLIKTADKKQGWIAKQYVTTNTPKPKIIEKLEQEIENLKKTAATECPELAFSDATSPPASSCAQQQQELTTSLDHNEYLQTQLNQCVEQLQTGEVPEQACSQSPIFEDLQNKLEKSKHRYLTLSQEYQKSEAKIANLENKLAKQDDRSRFYWFGAGALVFCTGLLFGKIQRRKRDRYIY